MVDFELNYSVDYFGRSIGRWSLEIDWVLLTHFYMTFRGNMDFYETAVQCLRVGFTNVDTIV